MALQQMLMFQLLSTMRSRDNYCIPYWWWNHPSLVFPGSPLSVQKDNLLKFQPFDISFFQWKYCRFLPCLLKNGFDFQILEFSESPGSAQSLHFRTIWQPVPCILPASPDYRNLPFPIPSHDFSVNPRSFQHLHVLYGHLHGLLLFVVIIILIRFLLVLFHNKFFIEKQSCCNRNDQWKGMYDHCQKYRP